MSGSPSSDSQVIPREGAEWIVFKLPSRHHQLTIATRIETMGLGVLTIKELKAIEEPLYNMPAVVEEGSISGRKVPNGARKQQRVDFLRRAFFRDDACSILNVRLLNELRRERFAALDKPAGRILEPLHPPNQPANARSITNEDLQDFFRRLERAGSRIHAPPHSTYQPSNASRVADTNSNRGNRNNEDNENFLVSMDPSRIRQPTQLSNQARNSGSSTGNNNHRVKNHKSNNSNSNRKRPSPHSLSRSQNPQPPPRRQDERDSHSQLYHPLNPFLDSRGHPLHLSDPDHPWWLVTSRNGNEATSNNDGVCFQHGYAARDGSGSLGPAPSTDNATNEDDKKADPESTPQTPTEAMLLPPLQEMGFSKQEILDGIRHHCMVNPSTSPTVDDIMLHLVTLREDAEDARLTDEARLASEDHKQDEIQRREQVRSNALKKATTQKDLLDIFPNSWIVKNTRHRQLETMLKGNSRDERTDLIEILKLEEKSRKWYGWKLPEAYFHKVAENLNETTHDASSYLCNECIRLRSGLYELEEQSNGEPRIFLQERPRSSDGSNEVIIIDDDE